MISIATLAALSPPLPVQGPVVVSDADGVPVTILHIVSTGVYAAYIGERYVGM